MKKTEKMRTNTFGDLRNWYSADKRSKKKGKGVCGWWEKKKGKKKEMKRWYVGGGEKRKEKRKKN